MKNPQVQPARSSVTQTKTHIEKFMALKESQAALRERMRLIQKSIDDGEFEIIQLIESGADLAHAGYAISIDVKEQRYPKWKEEVIDRLEKEIADEILESTRPTISKRLIVK